jgi:hypothetical protein
MSDLTNLEKRQFERLLEMGGGYVLDFSNRTFAEFVTDSVGRDIYDARYAHGSGSKANLLRGFWKQETNRTGRGGGAALPSRTPPAMSDRAEL